MNTLYDAQSLQAYALRLQGQARPQLNRTSRSAGRSLSPRLRALVHRGTS